MAAAAIAPQGRRLADGRRRAAALLLAAVALAVALRLVPVLVSPSIAWADEIFQAIEPAHRLVYGYGFVTWEFQLGMRSWLLPGTIAGLIEFARLIGDGPDYYLPVIAVAFAALASAPVVCAFLWSRPLYGLAGAFVAAIAVAVAPELVYFGARTLSGVVAAHLLVIAWYVIEPAYPVDSRRRFILGGALLGLVCLLRIQIAPAAAVLGVWSAGRAWRLRLPGLLVGGLAALLVGAGFDWLTLGSPLASIWRDLYYNAFKGISGEFGTLPWYFYLYFEAEVWGAATLLLIVLVAFGTRRMPALLVAALVVLAVHSVIPHKEQRFIYPALLLLILLSAFGLAQLTQWSEQWLVRLGTRPSLAAAISVMVWSGCWSANAYGVWSDPTMTILRRRGHDELAAVSLIRDLPRLCGLGLYDPNGWAAYGGGYTHLHRPVPVFSASSERDLASEAAAFNTLMYRTERLGPRPPSRTGFKAVRCFGDVCVARRPGGCQKRPMPPMWFPRRLRGLAPPPQRFQALPQRVQVENFRDR